jgi:hypothetical protein
MHNLKQTVIAVLASLALTLTAAHVLHVGLLRSERAECYQWQQQAREYPAFYLTGWQADQCAAHNITITTRKVERAD